MSALVFVPATVALAGRLRAGQASGPWWGYTASAGLRSRLAEAGSQPSDEECDYAALDVAGVAQLTDPAASDPRLVLAADVPAAALADVDVIGPGAVTVSELTWAQVGALFADEPGAAAAVEAARSAARGSDVDAAYLLPEVSALVDGHDLLWYAPEELDQIR